ncbi:SDR family oxidoreductase [Planktothrix mougeotii]|uniref:SDR family oxidoreductase n=1 Tax=Planktothrix mougeotii LEGE 06226 TaxID=1828728 RepID=A0ABR9U8W0_9CYAN|nr:SDR family oxidoreductase [Planktothrix mougeotii]MBE9142890.1 SDR family oxidoreductase [Planktothrix mougeotii LEGE 06226]
MSKIAIVTGANRGIGFETCRQLAQHSIKVILTSRDSEKGKIAAEELKSQGLDVISAPLTVTEKQSSQQLAEWVRQEFGRLDILVNNAGIYPDPPENNILNTDLETVQLAIETNVYGVLLVCQAFIPLMQIHNTGRIINVSSGMGQLSSMGSDAVAYRLSKVALNGLTTILAAQLHGSGITVNSICPGWVKTDMGGPNAPRTPEQGADTVVWLATRTDDTPTGGFWRDRQPIPW